MKRQLANLFVAAFMVALLATGCGGTDTTYPGPDELADLEVTSNVEATILIDGEYRGVTPARIELAAGKTYQVEVQRTGMIAVVEQIFLPSEGLEMEVTLTEPDPCNGSCRNDQICDEINGVCLCSEGKEEKDGECTAPGQCPPADLPTTGTEIECRSESCLIEWRDEGEDGCRAYCSEWGEGPAPPIDWAMPDVVQRVCVW